MATEMTKARYANTSVEATMAMEMTRAKCANTSVEAPIAMERPKQLRHQHMCGGTHGNGGTKANMPPPSVEAIMAMEMTRANCRHPLRDNHGNGNELMQLADTTVEATMAMVAIEANCRGQQRRQPW